MTMSPFCLVLCFLVSVLAEPEVSNDVEETIHIEYRSDTVLRYLKRHGMQDDDEGVEKESSVATKNGLKLLEIINKSLIKDSGHVENCNGHKKSQIDITWTPKTVSIKGKVTIDVNAIIPEAVASITGKVEVFIPGNPTPFITMPEKITCDKLKEVLPGIKECPIKAGQQLKGSGSFDLSPYAAKIPAGTFIAVATANNEKGQEIFCLNATITTIDPGR